MFFFYILEPHSMLPKSRYKYLFGGTVEMNGNELWKINDKFRYCACHIYKKFIEIGAIIYDARVIAPQTDKLFAKSIRSQLKVKIGPISRRRGSLFQLYSDVHWISKKAYLEKGKKIGFLQYLIWVLNNRDEFVRVESTERQRIDNLIVLIVLNDRIHPINCCKK